MPLDVSLADVVQAGVNAFADALHTAKIGIVDSYDASAQRAKVASAVRHPLLDADGAPAWEDFPVWDEVPVVWPRGASSGLHGALSSGDGVLLVFLDTSPAEWLQRGGTTSPADLRRHSAGYPIAIAGLAPSSSPLEGAADDAWELGFFGTATGRVVIQSSSIVLGPSATDPIVLAPGLTTQLNAILNALNALISKFNLHTHAVSGGTASPTTNTATPGSISDTYSSTLVKSL